MARILKLSIAALMPSNLKLGAGYRFKEFERDPAKYNQSQALRAPEHGKYLDISVSTRNHERPVPS
jgi:hypothetical protein